MVPCCGRCINSVDAWTQKPCLVGGALELKLGSFFDSRPRLERSLIQNTTAKHVLLPEITHTYIYTLTSLL